jgi:hypothetical protein
MLTSVSLTLESPQLAQSISGSTSARPGPAAAASASASANARPQAHNEPADDLRNISSRWARPTL